MSGVTIVPAEDGRWARFAERKVTWRAWVAAWEAEQAGEKPVIELNWPDADTLDRSRYPELRRLADWIPQTPESEQGVLYLEQEASRT